ncbi:Hypothetical predicted protein [Mytilus galloprovincialis]|uniref:WSC domain-containing protein n=1 Tax=Mytilus galloprovincialis TaxID=29158 RepID=A0A8B6FY37_MYTGA|nr:Hypothetical predicted protein [Mytilus galloprovincialis]
MLDTETVNDNMTVEMCVQLCMGNRYLGLQVCTNETNDSECNRECLGNSSQICDGTYRNSVYELTPTSNTEIITSVVTSTALTTPETSTVTTEPSVKTSALSTDWTATTLLTKSEVTTVQPISPLECQLCPCSKVGKGKWDFLRAMNLTLDQLRELLKPELDLMKKELSVNKYNTSRMRRSNTSAPDDRVSATSIGYVGVVVICLKAVLIVFFDILGCFVGKFKRRSSLQL